MSKESSSKGFLKETGAFEKRKDQVLADMEARKKGLPETNKEITIVGENMIDEEEDIETPFSEALLEEESDAQVPWAPGESGALVQRIEKVLENRKSSTSGTRKTGKKVP